MAEVLPSLTSDVREFLVDAKNHGYGSEWGKEHTVALADGSHQLQYKQGQLLYTDRWVGGNPFSGSEHVSWQIEDNLWRPFWGMSYSGEVLTALSPDEAELAITTLQKALVNPDPDFPARGRPLIFKGAQYYHDGPGIDGLERFDIVEKIIGKPVYSAMSFPMYIGRAVGRLVNRSSEIEQSGQAKWLQTNDNAGSG